MSEIRQSSPAKEITSIGALCCRLYWMFFGNIVLGISAYYIITHRLAFPHPVDLLCGGIVASLILIRYIDIARYEGSTADGEPATPAHWKRYSIFLLGISLCLIGTAHGIAFFLG